MSKSLVVVESPAKAKTINKILGKDFVVKPCMGHVRDLPPKELGIDVKDGFKPRYVTIRGKGKILSGLRKAAQAADTTYLATDPDREGEAIAWHVAQAISHKNDNVKRILFNEITPKAVHESLEHSGVLDLHKVDAQQARRVLDRLVGYEISPLLWKVIHSGLSAGRVQSVAVRLICERDREIKAFEPQEYWSIEGLLGRESRGSFWARLLAKDGDKLAIGNQEEADRIAAELAAQDIAVKEVKERDQMRRPAPPFTTSTLQQECARRMRFSVKRTMAVAQQLYEGVEVEGETRGLITYMRTDSVRVAADAIAEVREQIDALYGRDYVPETPNHYRTKNSAQDAHEAIRPTSVALHPDKVKHLLTPDQARVYSLIWKRFVTSQMKPQILNITTANVEAGPYLLRAAGSVVKFPGFTLLYSESKEEEDKSEAVSNGMAEGEEGGASRAMPADIAEGEVLKLEKIAPEQHFTKPPPRFTEASLVKQTGNPRALVVPRPTRKIITTILDSRVRRKRSIIATSWPLSAAKPSNKLLVDTFPHLFNVAFTANMEDKLDQIEDGDTNWVKIVQQFYDSWKGDLDAANSQRKELKRALQEVSDEDCEECGADMVVKWGRNGRFLACSGYPKCKNTKPLEEQGEVGDR